MEWTQQWLREERKVTLLLAKQVANLTNELNKGVAPTDANTVYNAAHAGLIQERKEKNMNRDKIPAPGSLVWHEVFGAGEVDEIRKPNQFTAVVVKFQKHGIKELIWEFAHSRIHNAYFRDSRDDACGEIAQILKKYNFKITAEDPEKAPLPGDDKGWFDWEDVITFMNQPATAPCPTKETA